MRITIITCTFNAAGVLAPTLESVLRQSHGDVEHLIIDGRSGDETVRLAEQYKVRSDMSHTGHRVVIISEPDGGLYDAMNKGLARATGRYLCFLNAGDRLPSADTLEAVARAAGEGEASVIYGETDIIDAAGRVTGHRRLHAPARLTWRSFRQGMLVCHQAFYALTDIARQTPYDLRYRVSADVDWCIRVMREGERRGLVTRDTRRVLAHYLAGGMSAQSRRRSLLERFQTMRRHYGLTTTLAMHLWFVVRAVIK